MVKKRVRQKTRRVKRTIKKKVKKRTRRHLRRQRGAGELSFSINYATIRIRGQDLTQQPKVYRARPTVTLSGSNKSKKYSIIMLDPDAPVGTWTHWFARVNATGTVLNEPYPYQPPSPPAGSGQHRYIFNVYEDLLETTPNNISGANGHDYYEQVLEPLLRGHKPIAEAVQFTVQG